MVWVRLQTVHESMEPSLARVPARTQEKAWLTTASINTHRAIVQEKAWLTTASINTHRTIVQDRRDKEVDVNASGQAPLSL